MPFPPTYPGQDYPGNPLSLGQIPSEESFDGPLNPARYLELDPIISEEAFGDLTPNRYVSLTSIGTSEAIGGIDTLNRYYDLASVLSEETVLSIDGQTEFIPSGVAFSRPQKALSVSERFSGVLLNQNVSAPEDGLALLDAPVDPDAYQYYQEFYLPKDYARGQEGTSRVPSLTGFQVFSQVETGWQDVAALDWVIQRYDVGDGWQTLGSGNSVGTEIDGNVWYTVYTDEIEILDSWIGNDQFRIGLRGRNSTSETFKEEVTYGDGRVLWGEEVISADLIPGVPYSFEFDGAAHSLYLDPVSNRTYLSVERGVTGLWATAPNPLAPQYSKLTDIDGNAILIDGAEASLMFRVLASIAEEGTDFLGNRYRTALAKTSIENVSTLTNVSANQYWLSKPNPSQFGIESLYFDITDSQDRAKTVDTILVDPLTPGVFFNIYYSSEGDPGTDEYSWDNKLWTRVPHLFQMNQRSSIPLPAPVTGRYIKIEFTHLQPRWYAPGPFQKELLYKKHPKWVLDYFLLRLATKKNTEDDFIGRRIKVTFDAFDLAYNYYVDDLDQQPLDPAQLGVKDESDLLAFLNQRGDASDDIDSETALRISSRLAPYAQQLSYLGGFDFLPTSYGLSQQSQLTSGERVIVPTQPTERSRATFERTDQVSSLDRDQLVYERGTAPMFFFIPCRHRYRSVTATFDNDKGYFAGVKELAFLRERYSSAYDTPLYLETAGDTFNAERNDFVMSDGVWTTYDYD